MRAVCRERRDVAITLANTEEVLATLSALVGGVLHVAACFAYLAIFGVDVSHLVISLSSVAIAFAFIFGDSVKRVYESVVFLFVERPFVVGDGLLYKVRGLAGALCCVISATTTTCESMCDDVRVDLC